ncbi:ABC transporter substrate-binding protein [Ruoffia sp. FAM 26255]|uniref:ABC transporter substrate-binding protein n=1 Tax=Ruoffia sp. FAM 26255 TaxID=3259519 RepID=UPI003887E126
MFNSIRKNLTKIIATATIATSAFTPALTAFAQDEDPINLGVIYELSGAVAAYGITQSNAIKMAVEEINEDGGVMGRPFNIVEYDTKSDDTEAAMIATRLATQDDVVAMIGPATTSQMQAAIPAANEYQIPLISPSVTNNDITFDDDGNVQPFVYRSSWSNSFQGSGIAKFGYENMEAEKMVVLYDNSSDYGSGLYDNFVEGYEGEIVHTETFTPEMNDFSAIISNIAAQDFDAITILAFYQTAGPIVKQAREFGIDAPILGSNGFGNDIIYELAGAENMNNVYYASLYPIQDEDEFVEKYRDQFDSDPDMFAALAYDTIYMLKSAIEQAGSDDPVAVNEALENLEEFSGITGDFTFDENHNPTKNVVNMIEIQNAEETAVHEVVFD